MRIRLVNCSVIDALDPNPRTDAAIQIHGDRIVWVGPASQAPEFDGARTLDLEGSFVLPGLIEAHAHLFWLAPRMEFPENVAGHTMYCAQQAINALKGGWTGLRCVGDGYWVDVALRDAFNAGFLLGPRLWASGEMITPTAGHGADREDFWGRRIVNGVDAWRQAARLQVQKGTDALKVFTTGGAVGQAHDIPTATTIIEEELQAAAQVAHSRGRRIIAHAAADDGIAMAVRAGAGSVEHGYFLTDDTIKLLIDSGTYLTPTLSITHHHPENHADDYERATFIANRRAEWKVKRAQEVFEVHRANFRRALKAGVKMLVGSDYAPYPGASHSEMSFLQRDGMSPWQIIVAATRNAADAVGQVDHLGTVEANKFADLIAVAENPLQDIRHLRQPRLVLRGGQAAVNQFGDYPPARLR